MHIAAINSRPLRERKFAQTKLSLLHAAIDRLEKRPLDDISVRELCAAVPVSEATFFNYFSKKTDLVVYVLHMWSIEVSWYAERARKGSDGGIDAIHGMYDAMARLVTKHPRVACEIIAVQARLQDEIEFGELTESEQLLAFPDMKEFEGVPAGGPKAIFAHYLAKSAETGEIDKNADLEEAATLLTSIFFGVPMQKALSKKNDIAKAYRRQLDIALAGLGSR